MPLFKCKECATVYPDLTREGTIIHHTCAPTMHNRQREIIPREVIRDENYNIHPRRGIVGIRSEGLGVECVSGEKLSEPAWITMLKKRVAKEGGGGDEA
jgi:hypothetical protein